jgi:predicted O-methyltransferase YrrM
MSPIKPPMRLYTRPRLLNPLHAVGMFRPHTQTNQRELACLARHASERRAALEIGSYMGVSACVIAAALNREGKLVCVDPWEPRKGRENPCWTICKRELRRRGVLSRVAFLQGYSHEVEIAMPADLDFIFVDGDHSYAGMERDWGIVLRHLMPGGILCLHDTTAPAAEPHLNFGAVRFFDENLRHHSDFEWLECCYSLNVMRRRRENE